MAKFSSINPQ
jgi:hypothetical protein